MEKGVEPQGRETPVKNFSDYHTFLISFNPHKESTKVRSLIPTVETRREAGQGEFLPTADHAQALCLRAV